MALLQGPLDPTQATRATAPVAGAGPLQGASGQSLFNNILTQAMQSPQGASNLGFLNKAFNAAKKGDTRALFSNLLQVQSQPQQPFGGMFPTRGNILSIQELLREKVKAVASGATGGG